MYLCVCVYKVPLHSSPNAAFRLYTYICICNFLSVRACVCAVTSNLCMYLSVCRRSSSKVHCSAAATPTRRLHVRIVNITKAACGAASFYVYIYMCVSVLLCVRECVCVVLLFTLTLLTVFSLAVGNMRIAVASFSAVGNALTQ